MPIAAKRRGIGTFCTVAKRFLYPAKDIDNCAAFFNVKTIENLVITSQGKEKLKTGRKSCTYFHYESLPGVTLYCWIKYAKVTTEGLEENFFTIKHRPLSRRYLSESG